MPAYVGCLSPGCENVTQNYNGLCAECTYKVTHRQMANADTLKTVIEVTPGPPPYYQHVEEVDTSHFGAPIPQPLDTSTQSLGQFLTESKLEMIDHPGHYVANGIEAIDVIEAFKLNFNLGNALKYLLRAGKKTSNATQDLNKARWFLSREISTKEL